jgi:DNA polymerase
LEVARLKREEIFVTGIVKCRPPRNRRPRRDEVEACRYAHLDHQLAVIKPSLVVLMGNVAAEEMLRSRRLREVVGRRIERDGHRYFATYHPAASMRFPAAKQEATRHFARLRELAA